MNSSIITADVDTVILPLVGLYALTELACVNKNLNRMVNNQSIYSQWKFINENNFQQIDGAYVPSIFGPVYIYVYYDLLHDCLNIYRNNPKLNFCIACSFGFVEYAEYLYHKYDLVMRNYGSIFHACCVRGQLKMAQWMFSVYEFDLELFDDYLFENSPVEVVNWLNDISGKS